MKNLIVVCFSVLFLSCIQSQEKVSSTALLITNVNVVDVRNGVIAKAQHIVIDSGAFTSISGQLKNPEDYKNRIDAEDQFILPGLSEMHAHIPSPPTSQTRIEETLFLYLSNGITTIRGMLGHPSHLELRERTLNGELLSPRIVTSSPSLNGNTVQTPEEARNKVTAYAKAGYDFLKIHPGIQLDVFEELAQTAREQGIPFAGHVPVDVGIHRAIESEFATIDHVDGFLEGLVDKEKINDPNDNGFFGFSFTPMADTSKIKDLVQRSKTKNVWVVPTQSLFERWYAPTTADEMLSQPEMKYMPRATLDNWRERKEQATGIDSGFDKDQWNTFIAIRRQLIKEIQDHGKGILLGSDAPQIFNVPGFSIHHEIEGMIRAGLTPVEVLQSGTINVAEYLDMQDVFGEIKSGLQADAVLVKNNPLENIAALKDIRGVLINGNWISREEIDKHLKEIELNANK
ncbi:MAG: amidohydrolase family protein [Flavobacteriaceae bacterium]